MFTGVIRYRGTVRAAEQKTHDAAWLCVQTPARFPSSKIGSSVAVNGVCLTVARKKGRRFFFNLVDETRRRSALGGFKEGDQVHLELPLRARDRLEGHFVQGHADGVGIVRRVIGKRKGKSFFVSYPARLRPFLVEKGSVAVDGVSLTLGKVNREGFWIHLVPRTLRVTHFGAYGLGTKVNLEADLLAKLFLRGSKLTSAEGHIKLSQS